ncbi:hypothetical protein LINPERHAP2_LOCUS16727 [Linum perenne]
MSAKKGERPSWIWSSLIKAKKVVALGAFKRVGDGSTININNDPWISSLPKFTTPFNGCSDRMVSDWIKPSTRDWDINRFGRFFSPQVITAILSVPVGSVEMEDEWTSRFREDGIFSVRTAYHARRDDANLRSYGAGPKGNDKLWRWLWNLSLPPKIKLFIWRCLKNAVATKDNLFHRKCS